MFKVGATDKTNNSLKGVNSMTQEQESVSVAEPQQIAGIRSDAVIQYLRAIAGGLSSIVVDITSQLAQLEKNNNKVDIIDEQQ